MPEIAEVLRSGEWYKSLAFSRKPQIAFISPKMVTNIIDETKQLKDQQDITPMALANLALEFAGNEMVLSKVLKKVVRLMQI